MITVSSPEQKGGTKKAAGNTTVTIAAAVGDFTGKLSTRAWILNMHYFKKAGPKEVLVNGKLIPKLGSRAAVNYEGAGWFMQNNQGNVQAMTQKGTVYIRTGNLSTSAPVIVTLTNGPSFPAVCLVPCDTTVHHQVQPQKFAIDTASGHITLTAPGNSLDGSCMTLSDNDDAASHTPAIEFERCTLKNGNQQWAYDTGTLNIHLKANKKSCMDQDGSDQRVISYGCGNKQANQQWLVHANQTQHITEAKPNGLCMSLCASESDLHAHRTSEPEMRRLRKQMYSREHNQGA